MKVARTVREQGVVKLAPKFHYFHVMRAMLERERDFTPATASVVDRHVLSQGSQEKVVHTILRKESEERPDLVLLTPTCTSSILQEDLQNFADRASRESACEVLLADVNHYRVNEFQAADRTLEQIVRFTLNKPSDRPHIHFDGTKHSSPGTQEATKGFVSGRFARLSEEPSVNILGIFTLGFHNQHDCRELKRMLNDLGIQVNEVLPEGASLESLQNLPKAWCNLVPYREIGLMTALYLEKNFQMPYVCIPPIGLLDTALCLREVCSLMNQTLQERSQNKEVFKEKHCIDAYIEEQTRFISQAAWFSRSIDCQNLTGKRAVVFGDATHAAALTRILTREMGVCVVCAGTYCVHDADWFREQVHGCCEQVLITDDHRQVNVTITKIEPAAIFGTQMERHIGKRLGIPCGVISAPIHIQNFPLGYRPFVGYEGTNNIADLIYNSYTLGMEDHLLEVFGGHDTKRQLLGVETSGHPGTEDTRTPEKVGAVSTIAPVFWEEDALQELQHIPGFVRQKVRKNTEAFAQDQGLRTITLDVMYMAKEAQG